MTLSAYDIIADARADGLTTLVLAAIEGGKQPVGGPVILPDGRLGQAMAAGTPAFEALDEASYAAGLTAHAGGGQTDALALTARINIIETCATAGDSVKLPASAPGASVVVANFGAAAAQVFGAGTETINGVATATGVPLPVGAVVTFRCGATGNWVAALKPPMPAQKYSADTATTDATIATAKVAGADSCTLNLTGALAAGRALTLPTAADIVAAIPNAFVGQTYRLRVQNSSSGNFAWTLTTNTGLTLTGTMTVAQNTFRDLLVTLTSLTAVAIQSLGQVIVAA